MDDARVSGKPIALILIVILVGAGLLKWWPSDRRAIHRQLDAIADTLTVPPAETALSRMTRLNELRDYFTPDTSILLGTLTLSSREALLAVAGRWSAPPGGVFVEYSDEIIEVSGDAATVSLTLKVSSLDQSSGERVIDERNARIGMVRQNGDWLIRTVEEPPGASEKARPGSP